MKGYGKTRYRRDAEPVRTKTLLNQRRSRISRREEEQNRIQAIRNHDCKKSGCGPICVFGDW